MILTKDIINKIFTYDSTYFSLHRELLLCDAVILKKKSYFLIYCSGIHQKIDQVFWTVISDSNPLSSEFQPSWVSTAYFREKKAWQEFISKGEDIYKWNKVHVKFANLVKYYFS